MINPETYAAFRQFWHTRSFEAINSYTSGQSHFIPNLLPELAVQMPTPQVVYLLEKRFGQEQAFKALRPDTNIDSPVATHTDASWLKRANMVGVNVRTIGSFWNVVKYAFTLPQSQNSVHLLPIWECGVVASLYGMASWHLNPEFFDSELAQHFPHLDTVEKQLRVVTNILHLMGKTVGMDVIPHTDRYSEVALANPSYFEWLKRKDYEIVSHEANLHQKVEEEILNFLNQNGACSNDYYPRNPLHFFDNNQLGEEKRLLILFGSKTDLQARNARRNHLIDHLFAEGYEPVPATMAPPYRGLVVDKSEDAKTVDQDGRVWRDYTIAKPQAMSRVFGPLARYKLYESKNNNQDWEIDFEAPRKHVWAYVAEKMYSFVENFGFDFMRGDMSHVQMNPASVPTNPSIYYDIHKYIKNYIAQKHEYFGYFGESFLAPPNLMAYGVEEDHLEASDADSTLGDLQSMTLGTEEFTSAFARYFRLLKTRRFAPNFTVMTADKDDPRFDSFYLRANELRFFLAIFLTDMPSYMGLGFEVRDPHYEPAPNEHYTKLYVFHYDHGSKATKGPYHWGQNAELFATLLNIRNVADQILPSIHNSETSWVIRPDENAQSQVLVWTQNPENQYLFIANLSSETQEIELNQSQIVGKLLKVLSTSKQSDLAEEIFFGDISSTKSLKIGPFEGIIYKIS
jgi:hypothetical protein